MLNEQAVREFQDIYFSEYGTSLSFDEASVSAEGLLSLYRAVLKPQPLKGDNKNYGNDKSKRLSNI